jgi:hypothetical protein
MNKIVSFKGEYARALDLAVGELDSRKLDLGRYEVSIYESADSLFVIFDSPDRQPNEDGSVAKGPAGFEVELSRGPVRVKKAKFMR